MQFSGKMNPNGKNILSRRMENIFPLNRKSDENDNYLQKCVQPNSYNESTNPEGVINLGVAWSFISDTIVNDKLKTIKIDTAQINGPYYGSPAFRQSMAKFYTRNFSSTKPLNPENLIITNGLTSTMDLIAHVIADSGEFFCTPTPTYAYFNRNFYLRSGIGLWPIDLLNPEAKINKMNEEKQYFELTASKVEEGIIAAINQGKTIRAFVLSNPSNPFGTVYSGTLVLEILEVCAKYKIHAIIDECSHLCIFNNNKKFESVVAFDRIPDPDRTHVLWTLTKDLSLGGARISTIYSFSAKVANCFKLFSPFYVTSPFQQNICQNIVDDQKWCDEVYFPHFLRSLRENYQTIASRLKKLGVIVNHVDGGFVMFVSFKKYLKSNTFEGEIDLLNHFVKHGVYLLPGQFIYCSEPGWFRIAFSFPTTSIELGIKRIEKAIRSYNALSKI